MSAVRFLCERARVLECGSPLPLFFRHPHTLVMSIESPNPARPSKSARGLAHSMTLARGRWPAGSCENGYEPIVGGIADVAGEAVTCASCSGVSSPCAA